MNRGEWFADSGYWLALSNAADAFHDRALALTRTLRHSLVTTEAVLTEIGNAMSRLRFREQAVALLNDIQVSPDIEVVPVTSVLFTRAIELYAARMDKEWGLTDCVSFVVMQERGITEALAADQHFTQAGFRALLRE